MTDELVKRHIEQLRLTGGDLADLCQPLADAIEQLTAERERLGRELNMAKYGRPDFAWSVHLAAMAELQAERDRLREALKGAESWLERWAVHVGNCAGGRVCTCGLTFVQYETGAALKGESHE